MKGPKDVIITSDGSGQMWSSAVWDPHTGSLLSAYKNGGILAFHTVNIMNGSYLLAADSKKPRLYLWQMDKQVPVQNLRLVTPGNVTAMSCTPDGLYVVVAVGEKLCVWQLSTGRLLAVIARHYQTITCLKFTCDGSIFVSGAEDGLVFVWSLSQVISKSTDRTTAEHTSPIYSLSDHSLAIKDLHVGRFGSQARLVSVSLDCTAKIYDIDNGTLLSTIVFDVPLTSVCMDIRENNLFIGCSNGNIVQFNLHVPSRRVEYYVEHKENKRLFQGHSMRVTCLSVSSDCCTLVSGSADGFVNIWHIPSRQCVRTIQHHGPVTSVLFTKLVDNRSVNELKPKLLVHGLQRISEESKDDFIEVSSYHDEGRLLSVESYFEENYDDHEKNSSRSKLSVAQEEIKRLKRINTAIYQSAVRCFTKLDDYR